MKFLSRIPLYLGLSVFIFSVILSASRMGEKKNLANLQSRANVNTSRLSMQFTHPNTVSILFNSPVKIAGADISLKYPYSEMDILSSSLKGGRGIRTSGGMLDRENGVFSFSAVSSVPETAGILASFEVSFKNGGQGSYTIDFNSLDDAVILVDTDNRQIKDVSSEKLLIEN